MSCSSLAPGLPEVEGLSFMEWRGSASEFRTRAGSASCIGMRLSPSGRLQKDDPTDWPFTKGNVARRGKVPRSGRIKITQGRRGAERKWLFKGDCSGHRLL